MEGASNLHWNLAVLDGGSLGFENSAQDSYCFSRFEISSEGLDVEDRKKQFMLEYFWKNIFN